MNIRSLLLVGLLGCSTIQTQHLNPPNYTHHIASTNYPHRLIPVDIDENFTNEERIELVKAIGDWNFVLNREMDIGVRSIYFNMEQSEIDFIYAHHGFMMLKISETGPLAKNLDPNITAMADDIGGHIVYFIAEKINLTSLRVKATHELAHLLGAEHTNIGTMQREYRAEAYSCIDYGAVSQVAQYNGLDVNRMNWCVR